MQPQMHTKTQTQEAVVHLTGRWPDSPAAASCLMFHSEDHISFPDYPTNWRKTEWGSLFFLVLSSSTIAPRYQEHCHNMRILTTGKSILFRLINKLFLTHAGWHIPINFHFSTLCHWLRGYFTAKMHSHVNKVSWQWHTKCVCACICVCL